MRVFQPESIHNVALIAHGGSGKTSLTDVALFDAGVVTRIGRVDDGSSVVDNEPEEIKRRMTLTLKVTPVEWREKKINLLDTPGYIDLVGEVKAGLRAADSAVVLVSAEKGVEIGTELVWSYADERSLPRMVLVTKLDRENTSFDRALTTLQAKFGKKIAPLHIPIGSQAQFTGVVDLCKMTAFTFENGKATEGPIPAAMMETVATYRTSLIEAAVETDDDLMMKYLDGGEITNEELCAAVQVGAKTGIVIPVLAASLTKNIGISLFLDAINDFLPSAADAKQSQTHINGNLAAFVFKTLEDPQRGHISMTRVYRGALKSDMHVWNAHTHTDERIGQLIVLHGKQSEIIEEIPEGDIACIVKLSKTHTGDTLCSDKDHILELPPIAFPAPSFATVIEPKSKTDLDKLGHALNRIVEEDPCIHVERDSETADTLLSGVGESHLDITIERLQRKFGVEVLKHDRHIPYRETIRKTARANGRYKKQSGGHGMFGDVILEIAPLPFDAAEPFIFENKIVGGVVPREYVPGVEKGVREWLQHGYLAGFHMIGIRVALVDGKYHPVDSNSQAFEFAASMAMKEAMKDAAPTILEPIMRVAVTIPDAFTGELNSTLNTKRGRILGIDSEDTHQIITAQVPMSEMLHFSTDLRSITQGRGSFSMELDHYEEVPITLQQSIIDSVQKAQAS